MSIDAEYRNDSRYRRGIDEPQGRIFLSGQQALVRMMLAQAGADRAAGLNTAGFVTGYRGSPLGGLDHELWRAKALLEPSNIRFQPAINEDLAATALIGTQRVETDAARRYDGVFGMWYGKGPGVDRSGDALKHGNAYGSSPHGGVLVVTGDDHGCVSSSMSHQSDRTLVAWGMPVVHPAGLADYERCGLWGWALSRASGLWVGFKAITDTVEASTSLQTSAPPGFTIPPVDPGPDGLHWRWPDLPGMQIERRHRYKLEAARAFIRTNPLDEAVTTPARPVLVIGAVGKAYRDVREVLQQGGISLDRLEQAGVALLKINLVYPLSPLLETWAKRAAKVLVIEEKQAVVEDQLKQRLYNIRHDRRATIIGKTDENGRMLLSEQEELRPSRIAQLLLQQLAALDLALHIPSSWIDAPAVRAVDWVKRTPYLCSGCPHNTSTRVPDGSEARLGIGCHAMAARMPERATSGSVQMGGEGVDWLGQAPFVETPHIFQNIGDGTFFHSGYLAIRQAVAARATITYKLLYNDAVAMTGGQPVDGSLDVRKAIDLVRSEGVQRVVVVADDPDRYKARARLPRGVELFHRDQLDNVQRQLRETRGVSVLIFDQVCATEARRRKKQQPAPAIATQVVINETVCEGCGDCQVKSNCLSVVSVDTPFGAKRSIDAHSCNTDLSCVKGFCPSFVTITGKPRTRKRVDADHAAACARADALALPVAPRPLDAPFEILLTGVGGTGVVTVAGTIALAAHLDGLDVSVLDFTGFAQKGGAVLSHVRIARDAESLHQYRIDRGGADVLLAADLLVATEDDGLAALRRGRTQVIANTAQTQTGAMLRDPGLRIETDAIQALIKARVGEQSYVAFDAKQLATDLLDPMQANMLLLGYAWQRGAIPVSLAALRKALDLQGGSASARHQAIAWGRLCAADPDFVASQFGTAPDSLPAIPIRDARQPEESVEERADRRSTFLTQYQNARYAARYRQTVERVSAAARAIGDVTLADAVARNLFKLMAYKDEYEVARLHSEASFLADLRGKFAAGAKLTFHLAPPLLDAFRKGGEPAPRKLAVGGWMIPLFRILAAGRVLRHTPFDPFGWTAERREERRLVRDYESTLLDLLPRLTREKLPHFVAWANVPDSIRGYGYIKLRAIEAARKRQIDLVERILSERSEHRVIRIESLEDHAGKAEVVE
ncbi:indolepyruvate ferredoxin oxidoreductase family protein [Burkholderia stabilis]|uniref:4Fe-4S ferredoxin-type domain-containing protein n=1 Tax=Burkholderia stabilis TaxID=95485 RepID=A0AAJ5NEM9_9BURK|nr:indolepyruvate ferredoxin oxidoreductase family protein [Burkholderia stabilis]VBB13960.1 2-oxoacid ferredoxin oxidoreductase,Indolepyruvate ferredoxin oxidoreductase, alpha and beta subunits,indolepyruvate ferredoxin oxidoreductase, alpha subunit,Pyruvate ferredoxin/flavodoxin oxidoreductase [Burkholderia stabilis]